MKREILFRGKVTKVPKYMQDKNRMSVGDWVYGSYVDYPVAQIFDLEDEYIVDPATVGQFTGLCDKNGKKIFEGDVVFAGYGEYYQSTHEYSTTIIIDMANYEELNALCNANVVEVIGNIHGSPELAKEEAE